MKGLAYRVLGGQGIDLQGPRFQGVDPLGPSRSRGLLLGSQGVKGRAYSVTEDEGVGLKGPKWSRGRPTVSQGIKGWPKGSQGSRGGPTGSQGMKG